MPLILAIEPDKRQAAQLKVLVKNRLRADLILADTTEPALGSLPAGDYVLTVQATTPGTGPYRLEILFK